MWYNPCIPSKYREIVKAPQVTKVQLYLGNTDWNEKTMNYRKAKIFGHIKNPVKF